MQSAKHLGILELLGRDLPIIPELVARAQGHEPPRGLRFERRDGRMIAYSFTGPPREIQVDLLLLAYLADVPGGSPQIVTPFECQLGRDADKLYRALEYIAAARRDFRCPGQTAMFSPDPQVLESFRKLFAREPHFCPVLVGRDAVPRVLTVEQAVARPELATLSAIVHSSTDANLDIARAVVGSWGQLGRVRRRSNARVLHNCLTETTMNALTQTDEYTRSIEGEDENWEPSEWERNTGMFQRAHRYGRLAGRLCAVLELRGMIPTTAQQARIDACTSTEQLERWLARAGQSGSIDELLGS